MILAVDVDYQESTAVVAGVLFENWQDEKSKSIFKSFINNIEDYIPGQFYKRELPCIIRLLKEHKLEPNIIVVDGHVYLDENLKPGLGKYLFEALKGKVAIIGVAKKAFFTSSKGFEVFRGGSQKPLYVTSEGIGLKEAKVAISSMHGKHRNPTLLKLADHKSKFTHKQLLILLTTLNQ
jgi:deoxyribonuclease V